MSASLDPGPVRDALIALISANQTAKFNALDTEYDDSITLDDIASDNIHKALMDVYPGYPAAVLFPERNEPSDDYSGFQNRRHSFQVRVFIVSNEAVDGNRPPEVMEIRLERTMRGITEVFDENRTLSVTNLNQASIDVIGTIDYLDFDVTDTGRYRRSAVLPVEVLVK